MKYKICIGGVVLIACLLLCSCSILPTCVLDAEFFSSAGDLHIYEDCSYPGSPFDSLTNEAFLNDTHYCTLLDIGDEALLMRVYLARIAQKAIYLQTYIWKNDESGRLMMYELIQAAKRGVKVKIIVDQLAHNLDPKTVAFLSTVSPNLEIKFYNPNVKEATPTMFHYLQALIRFNHFNQRMHNKIFIVDDQIGITGGRNYENDYFDRGKSRNFIDRDVMIVGSAVKAMTDSLAVMMTMT